ncbi:MAG: hypothetical protein ACOZBW_08900 [Thermodesulfobacteriota bacterium]
MDLDYLLHLANTFFHTHTYLSMAIAAGLAVMACLRPKQMFKTVLVILACAAAACLLYYLGEATLSGLSGKEQMIQK